MLIKITGYKTACVAAIHSLGYKEIVSAGMNKNEKRKFGSQ